MSIAVRLLGVVAVLGPLGCSSRPSPGVGSASSAVGSSSSALSCDYRANLGAAKICQEWTGVASAQHDSLKSICQLPQVWAESGCPRTGALGGCSQISAGITATIWFYADAASGLATTSDVMSRCATNNQTFVSP